MPKDHVIQIRVDASDFASIRSLAALERLPVAAWCRSLLVEAANARMTDLTDDAVGVHGMQRMVRARKAISGAGRGFAEKRLTNLARGGATSTGRSPRAPRSRK